MNNSTLADFVNPAIIANNNRVFCFLRLYPVFLISRIATAQSLKAIEHLEKLHLYAVFHIIYTSLCSNHVLPIKLVGKQHETNSY